MSESETIKSYKSICTAFRKTESGLNDNLNGIERPVSFGVKEQNDAEVEIVHSLAKWKREALKRYGFSYGEGIYTDMNAIRRMKIRIIFIHFCGSMGLGENY